MYNDLMTVQSLQKSLQGEILPATPDRVRQGLEAHPEIKGDDRDVLELRFGLCGDEPMTFKAIGVKLGVKPTTLQKIEKTTLARLSLSRGRWNRIPFIVVPKDLSVLPATPENVRARLEEYPVAITKRERMLLELRNGLRGQAPMTLADIGRIHFEGIGREAVRFIEAGALAKLSLTPLGCEEWKKIHRNLVVPGDLSALPATPENVRTRLETHPNAVTNEEHRILELRFGLQGETPMRSKAIANKLGLSLATVSNREHKSLRRLSLVPLGVKEWGKIYRELIVPKDLPVLPATPENVRDRMQEYSSALSACQRKTVTFRYGLDGNAPKKNADVGLDLQMSCGAVAQHERRALKHLQLSPLGKAEWRKIHRATTIRQEARQ